MKHLLSLVIFSLYMLPMASCVSTGSEGESEGIDWREEPHHLSFLLGNTLPDEESGAGTVGIDYEYRVSERIGVGGVIEYAGEDLDALTALLAFDIHLTPQWIVQVGPGVEFIDSEQEGVFRLGMLYEFELDGYTASPQLHRDWTRGDDSWVLAMAFGWGF